MIPTPTPLPDMSGNQFLEIPDINAWEFADDAVQVWNSASEFGLPQVMQAFLLILIISAIIGTIIWVSKRMTDDGT